MASMDGKVCIVTGSNTGIGKETARGLAVLGATVVLACRDLGKAEAAKNEIALTTGRNDLRVMKLDLSDGESIRAFVKEFLNEFTRLDVLVNNAGVWTTQRTTTRDGFETTFGTNHLGTFLLTDLLLPILRASAPSRVVVLSSALHYRGTMDWNDLHCERKSFSGPGAYNQSKLANVLFTKALARRLSGANVTVNAVHPGVVATELARDYPKLLVKLFHLFTLSPSKGAVCSLYVATSPECATRTGEYFEKSKSKKAAAGALSETDQEKLWTLSEEAWKSRSPSVEPSDSQG